MEEVRRCGHFHSFLRIDLSNVRSADHLLLSTGVRLKFADTYLNTTWVSGFVHTFGESSQCDLRCVRVLNSDSQCCAWEHGPLFLGEMASITPDQRYRLVYMTKELGSASKAAEICGVNKKTANKWVKRHRETGAWDTLPKLGRALDVNKAPMGQLVITDTFF